MIETTLQLNKVIAADKAIYFETNEGIFVGHNDPTNIMNPIASLSPEYNKWNFNILETNTMISNIYPLSAFTIQSYQYKRSPLNRQNNISDHLSIFGLSDMYMKGCQYFNYGYLLSDLTDKTLLTDRLKFNNDLFVTSYLERTNIPVDTYIYPALSTIISDITSGSNTMVPLYNLSGVKFNYIEECPLTFKYYGYEKDNTSGSYYYAFGDSFNAKNQYNHNYSLSAITMSATNTSGVSATLTDARRYYDINTTGDTLYLVYKNNQYYNSGRVSLSGTGVTFNMTPTASFASTGAIIDIPLITNTVLSSNPVNNYDNVETIYSVNRLKDINVHKSNLFSINIQNANIDSSSLSAEDKENIKKSLSNILETLLKNVIPANTQLFKIYWNGA